MYYGLSLSASGVLVNTTSQDVYANNLANVETIGFKPMMPGVQQRPPESQEDPAPFGTANELLDKLGGGVFSAPMTTGFKAAPPESTGRPLDAALTGNDTFFAVRVTNPNTGDTTTQLTRNGRFLPNSVGQLVTTAGHLVLDPNDQPITIDPNLSNARIDATGRIIQDQQAIAQVQVTRVPDAATSLRPAGDNTFAFRGADNRQPLTAFGLLPKHVETSGASPISTLNQMIAATKAANGNASMIRYQDTMMDRAINTLGRVA
ncbi:MAG: flagellar hook-basal body complex protein [Planctomycetota bacterium]